MSSSSIGVPAGTTYFFGKRMKYVVPAGTENISNMQNLQISRSCGAKAAIFY